MTGTAQTQIPKAYRTFEPLFAQMDAPLLRALSGLLRALPDNAHTSGDFQNQPLGEFVGYDGLENRGALSNLLETEWLLRELDPDDFARRVAEGEVLFRKRNFQDAGNRQVFAAILDCGPWMLGRNRLFALAALFHLAIRAQRVKADLMWIVPGARQHDWCVGLSRETVSTYLGQIVQTPINTDTIDTALARLAAQTPVECWYVGAQQTAAIAAHPGVTGALSVHTGFNDAHGRVTITHRNRTLAKIDIAFQDDTTCVAALRRPFKPEAGTNGAPRGAGDQSVLTTRPFQTGWMFDRHNQAAQIHLDEGVLWQPLMPPNRRDGVWIAVPEGKVLLGLQVNAKKRLSALIATPPDTPQSGARPCEVAFFQVDLGHPAAKPKQLAQGVIQIDPDNYGGHPVGNLHVEPVLTLVGNDTTQMTFGIDHKKRLSQVKKPEPHILLIDPTYRMQVRTPNRTSLTVFTIKRGVRMLRARGFAGAQDFETRPRHTLYSPHTKVAAISYDAKTYHGYCSDYQDHDRADTFTVTLPDGLTLLHLDSSTSALAWDRENAHLVQVSFTPGRTTRRTLCRFDGPETGLPRYCALTGTTFAIQSDATGTLEFFVRIHAKKGWSTLRPMMISKAIETARTIWLGA
ncbi:MAG: hypothetical protein AB8B51_12200 [Sedimentitalea sp.]